jgi:hypothetical protein
MAIVVPADGERRFPVLTVHLDHHSEDLGLSDRLALANELISDLRSQHPSLLLSVLLESTFRPAGTQAGLAGTVPDRPGTRATDQPHPVVPSDTTSVNGDPAVR